MHVAISLLNRRKYREEKITSNTSKHILTDFFYVHMCLHKIRTSYITELYFLGAFFMRFELYIKNNWGKNYILFKISSNEDEISSGKLPLCTSIFHKMRNTMESTSQIVD